MFEFIQQFLSQFIDIILHLNIYLNEWAIFMGPWLYVLLGFIIFCETGLVFMPFLPGDSLLFAIGALAATPNSPINIYIIIPLLIICAIVGDNTNYFIGRKLGPAVFNKENSKLLNKKHLVKAKLFYEKYGKKTIIIARFVPIIRTFAPFVAGIGQMKYLNFLIFSLIGGVSWVSLFTIIGYKFGLQPIIQQNFHYAIFAIIIISIMPIIVEFIKEKRNKKSA